MIYTIGSHKVKHGDITEGIADLMGSDKARIFYSDPPWGQGNLKYWQTMNKKMTGAQPKEVNYVNFLKAIFQSATTYTTDIVLIEYGIQWRNDIVDFGRNHGLKHNGIANLLYRSGSRMLPLDLHLFSKKPINIPNDYFKNLEGTSGYNTLKNAIPPFAVESDIILDPCCGMGYTAKASLEANMSFRGNELNAKRLQKTIDRLTKTKK